MKSDYLNEREDDNLMSSRGFLLSLLLHYERGGWEQRAYFIVSFQ